MSKRSDNSAMPSEKRKRNHSTDMSKETREAVARVFNALLARGMPRTEVDAVLAEAGYGVPAPTMYKWQQKLNQNQSLFSPINDAGRPRKLTDEQTRLVVGFVLHQNSIGQKVRRALVTAFVSDTFGVSYNDTSIGRLLAENGFSLKSHRAQRRETLVTRDEAVEIAFQFVKDVRSEGLTNELFYNVDFTYTSRRRDDHRGYCVEGVRANSLAESISPYTNCIVTCFGSDGSNIPAMLFTANPAFRTDRSEHWRAKQARARLTKLATEKGVKLGRIVYLSNYGGKYVSEKAELLEQFLAYNVLQKAPIFSDGGKALTSKANNVIEKAGYKHVILPSVVHQYLSVNDNNAHGVAKAQHARLGLDWSDDVNASLELLARLDNLDSDVIQGWFTRNYMLDCESLIRDDFERLIVGPPHEQRHFHNTCLTQYRVRFAPQTYDNDASKYQIWSELDGSYWVL